MEYKITEQGSRIVFALNGKFTHKDLNEFNRQFSTLEGKPIETLEFDFSELDFIDSMGMGLLIKVHDDGERRGYHTVIRNAKGAVLKILENANFGALFGME